MLPKHVAIIKVWAHTKEWTKEANGNATADATTKAAALLPQWWNTQSITESVDFELLGKIQQQAPENKRVGEKEDSMSVCCVASG